MRVGAVCFANAEPSSRGTDVALSPAGVVEPAHELAIAIIVVVPSFRDHKNLSPLYWDFIGQYFFETACALGAPPVGGGADGRARECPVAADWKAGQHGVRAAP